MGWITMMYLTTIYQVTHHITYLEFEEKNRKHVDILVWKGWHVVALYKVTINNMLFSRGSLEIENL